MFPNTVISVYMFIRPQWFCCTNNKSIQPEILIIVRCFCHMWTFNSHSVNFSDIYLLCAIRNLLKFFVLLLITKRGFHTLTLLVVILHISNIPNNKLESTIRISDITIFLFCQPSHCPNFCKQSWERKQHSVHIVLVRWEILNDCGNCVH